MSNDIKYFQVVDSSCGQILKIEDGKVTALENCTVYIGDGEIMAVRRGEEVKCKN